MPTALRGHEDVNAPMPTQSRGHGTLRRPALRRRGGRKSLVLERFEPLVRFGFFDTAIA